LTAAAARRRVVVTGTGVVSALGNTTGSFWQSCLAGRTAVAPIPEQWRRYSSLRSPAWSPLGDWDRESSLLTRLERKRLDITSQLAVLAAEEALTEAGLELRVADGKRNTRTLVARDPERLGVFMGTGVGGVSTLLAVASHVMLAAGKERLAELASTLDAAATAGGGTAGGARLVEAVLAELPSPVSFNPFAVTMAMPNAVSANLAIKLGLHGPCPTFTCACASGTVAIGQAFRALRGGECDFALAGGTEYLWDAYGCTFRGFDAVGALAQGDLPLAQLNRPFDRRRCGFLFSEGGCAVLVLEELESARRRGARPLAEVRGFGETCDGHDLIALEPSGREARRAIELCLADACLAPEEIGYVNAHGTGTSLNDPLEAQVVAEALGPEVAVSSTKSLLGHTLGASGALEAVATVRTLLEGVAHGCRCLEEPVAELRFLTRATRIGAAHALSQSFAFGGQNAVLALSRC
jgi:3-oxoacyl-[acyl-carrier-protein] synthase II